MTSQPSEPRPQRRAREAQALRENLRAFVFGHLAARGMPCLMVTHDPADVPQGGRVLFLKNNEVTYA